MQLKTRQRIYIKISNSLSGDSKKKDEKMIWGLSALYTYEIII